MVFYWYKYSHGFEIRASTVVYIFARMANPCQQCGVNICSDGKSALAVLSFIYTDFKFVLVVVNEMGSNVNLCSQRVSYS
mgnify:CR=1 FL=1